MVYVTEKSSYTWVCTYRKYVIINFVSLLENNEKS